MAELTAAQQRFRSRIEALIGLAAPALDVVLAVGERISWIAEREDHEYYPVRPGGDYSLPSEPDVQPEGGPEDRSE